MKIAVITKEGNNGKLKLLTLPSSVKTDVEVEAFLANEEHNVGMVSWIHVPDEGLMVSYYDYDDMGLVDNSGADLVVNRNIHQSVNYLKEKETERLSEALEIYGEECDDEWEFEFDDPDNVIYVVAYDRDGEPQDFVVTKATCDFDGIVRIYGYDKNECDAPHQIPTDDIMVGYIDEITEYIVS